MSDSYMKIAIVDDDVNDRELLIQLIKASLEHEAYAFVINHEAPNAITQVELCDLGFEVGQILDVEWGRTVDFERTAQGIRFTIMAVEGTPTGVTRLLKITPKK